MKTDHGAVKQKDYLWKGAAEGINEHETLFIRLQTFNAVSLWPKKMVLKRNTTHYKTYLKMSVCGIVFTQAGEYYIEFSTE